MFTVCLFYRPPSSQKYRRPFEKRENRNRRNPNKNGIKSIVKVSKLYLVANFYKLGFVIVILLKSLVHVVQDAILFGNLSALEASQRNYERSIACLHHENSRRRWLDQRSGMCELYSHDHWLTIPFSPNDPHLSLGCLASRRILCWMGSCPRHRFFQ